MSDLATLIKEAAHFVSDEYLRNRSKMNDSIFAKSNELGLNEEVVKRICELANQNVYLSLFHDPSSNKANIQFEMADYSQILNKLKKSEQDMNDYKKVPKSFKSDLSALIESKKAPPKDNAESEDFQNRKLASMDELQYGKNKYQKMLNSLETMKVACETETKEAFSRVFNDTKLLASQGDSIADMAKVAMRYTKDLGFDMIKIAKVYDMIATELKNNGYTVNEELTKISSCVINTKSKILEPVKDYITGISKISSFNEMCENVKKVISMYDNEIEKIAVSMQGVKSGLSSAASKVKNFATDPAMHKIMAADLITAVPAGYVGSKLVSDRKNDK